MAKAKAKAPPKPMAKPKPPVARAEKPMRVGINSGATRFKSG